MFDIDDLKPPRPDDILFRDDLHDGHNAVVNYKIADYHFYMEGYRRGARQLAEHVITSNDHSVLVYPIVFLYRHYIELVLKRIILSSFFLIDRQLSETEEQHLKLHRLDLLWKDLESILDNIRAATRLALEPEGIAGVDSYIRQLAKLDPHSDSFRYERSKKGDRSLPKDLNVINVRHFSEMMERLVSYLSGIESAVSDSIDVKHEVAAEWGRD